MWSSFCFTALSLCVGKTLLSSRCASVGRLVLLSHDDDDATLSRGPQSVRRRRVMKLDWLLVGCERGAPRTGVDIQMTSSSGSCVAAGLVVKVKRSVTRIGSENESGRLITTATTMTRRTNSRPVGWRRRTGGLIARATVRRRRLMAAPRAPTERARKRLSSGLN
jgi:hypothetical protein